MDDNLRDIVKRVVAEALGSGARADRAPADAAGSPPTQRPGSREGGSPPQPAAHRDEHAPQPPSRSGSRPADAGRGPSPAPTAATGAGPVAIGADHGGYALKEALKSHLEIAGYTVIDCGTHSTDSVDYPDFARAVAVLVGEGKAWRGIVIDGAGIGSCMAANKIPGVRASLCYDHATAHNAREHNDANVLTLGAGLIGQGLAVQITETWLTTEFGGGRHGRRVDKIMEIENR